MCKIDFEAHWAGDKLPHLILTLLFWILKFAQVKPWILCASNNDNELPIFLPLQSAPILMLGLQMCFPNLARTIS